MMDVYQVILSLVTALFIVLWYHRIKFNYWSSRGISGPPPTLILGNLLSFFKEPVVFVYAKWAKTYGKVFGIYERSKPILVVTDAELIKEIYIKKFDNFVDRRELGGHKLVKLLLVNRRGDDWRRCRAIISPSFTASKMKGMFPLMQEAYQQLNGEMEKICATNKPIVIKELYNKLTSTVIARCAFATKINPFTDPDDPVIQKLTNFFSVGWRTLSVFLFPNWVLDMIQFTFPEKASFLYICELCRSVVKQRRATGKGDQNYPDLLQLMMDAKVETNPVKESVPDHESHHMVEDKLQTKSGLITESTAQLDEDEIVANSALFFAAGFETTATTLNFATYCLARNPEVQEKLHQTIKKAFADNEVTYETLTGITYLDAFVSEVLRFLPPPVAPEREANSDVVLSNGLKIEKGTYVRFPIYTIHHNPEYFPDPEEFKVERFLPENRDKIIPGSYLPFTIGPRNCIGMRFALMEIKLTLAKLVLKYKFVLTEDVLKNEPKFVVAGPIIRFANDLAVKVERRND